MNKKKLIQKIEGLDNTRIVVYVTGDRKPFTTRIADDVIPLFNSHLKKFKGSKRISLFLYTRGGDMITPIRLAKLIRSYCDHFDILIPYRAHSAGTLIALGADRIIMGKLAELSPVDPTTGHPFNPQNPTNPQQRLEVSVEDLNSYFMVAREMAKVKEDYMGDVFKHLVDKLHPLSVGNAYRAYRMAKILVKNLLELHMRNTSKIGKIVNALTSEICIHGYPITRDEALNIGLNIEKPSEVLEKEMWDLYQYYERQMKLGVPFTPIEVLGDKELSDFKYVGAYIDSSDLSYGFTFKGKIQRIIRDNKPVMDLQIPYRKWNKIGG